MATRKVNALEEEKMTDANIARVIELLEPKEEGKQPITKKLACELLGMTYNTTRLGTIIQAFKDKKALDKKRRAERRGKAASADEINYSISEYIKGETIDAIAKALYRSPLFVRNVLDRNAVPIRALKHDYFRPGLVPEDAVRESFRDGEVVYSVRYDSTARIEGKFSGKSEENVYRIWLLSDKWHQFAYQPASELASLEHLREMGIRV